MPHPASPLLKSIAEITATCDAAALPAGVDLQGWNSDPAIFDRLCAETQPDTIIEVGTWKGRSTAHLAANTETIKPDIFCVDTWLGGVDHFLSSKPQDDRQLDAVNSPRLYHRFLANFKDSPSAGRIYPIQQTSQNGARILGSLGIKADLIYLDASHEYEDVYADLLGFFPLLKPGGVIFGDDFRAFRGVFGAVLRFSVEQNLKLEEVDHNFWIFRS